MPPLHPSSRYALNAEDALRCALSREAELAWTPASSARSSAPWNEQCRGAFCRWSATLLFANEAGPEEEPRRVKVMGLEPTLHQAQEISIRLPVTSECPDFLQKLPKFRVRREMHAKAIGRQWLELPLR
jgi:hypothetical protein